MEKKNLYSASDSLVFLILIGDRKDIKFLDSVRKSQGQKAEPKLMNTRT